MAKKKTKEDRAVGDKSQRACYLKRSYKNKKHALAGVISHMTNKGMVVYPYKCPVCGLFHLTKQEQRKQ